jgi:Saposin-like type B, region 1
MYHFKLLCCSMGIKSVVDKDSNDGVMSDAMCSACELAVVWMQNQLMQNQTQEHIFDYVDKVTNYGQPLHLSQIEFLISQHLFVANRTFMQAASSTVFHFM